jgi:hypothetical protein
MHEHSLHVLQYPLKTFEHARLGSSSEGWEWHCKCSECAGVAVRAPTVSLAEVNKSLETLQDSMASMQSSLKSHKAGESPSVLLLLHSLHFTS